MAIPLEQIDLLRKRAKVSYQDAKDALEKCNNDIVEALVYLENQNKIKGKNMEECKSKFFSKIKEITKKGNTTKFVVKKNDRTVIDMPVTIMVILGIFATPILVMSILAALFTKHKIKFEKSDGKSIDLHKMFEQVSPTANTTCDPSSTEEISIHK